MSEPALYGYAIWPKWHCQFPFEGLSVSKERTCIPLSPEPRIAELSRKVDLRGLKVLELGSMEGAHSYMLESLGAGEVLAIEGRTENFLKSLVVKNAFNLKKCTFLLGDFQEILGSLAGGFDLCLALGVLYHLEDPVKTLHSISALSGMLYIWSHYATEDFPEGKVAQIVHASKTYRGKHVREDAQCYTSGLSGRSFWLFEEELLRSIRDAGFREIEVLSKERHEHGPAVTLLAKK